MTQEQTTATHDPEPIDLAQAEDDAASPMFIISVGTFDQIEVTMRELPTVPCTRCATPTQKSLLIEVPATGDQLCRSCAASTCQGCGARGRADIMARSPEDRILCTTCCSVYPGREWMQGVPESARRVAAVRRRLMESAEGAAVEDGDDFPF